MDANTTRLTPLSDDAVAVALLRLSGDANADDRTIFALILRRLATVSATMGAPAAVTMLYGMFYAGLHVRDTGVTFRDVKDAVSACGVEWDVFTTAFR